MNREIVELCLARVKGEKMNFSAKEADQAIRNAFIEKFGTDKMNRKIYRRHAVEIFEIIEEIVDQTIVDSEMRKNTFFDQFVETRTNAEGQANLFYIPSDTDLVVARMSRGNWTLERQRIDQGKEISIPMSTYGVKVYTEFVSFVAGRIDFPALIAKMTVAFERFVAQLAYDTFVKALTGLPSIFKYSGAYDADKVMNIVSSVEGVNESSAIIIGTKSGLSKLQASYIRPETMSEVMKNELNANGFLATWNGTTCIEIPQGFKAGSLIKTDAGKEVPDFIFDDKQLFVVTANGQKPVKMYYEGSEMSRSVSDAQVNEDMTLEEELVMNVGSAVFYDRLFGSISLT